MNLRKTLVEFLEDGVHFCPRYLDVFLIQTHASAEALVFLRIINRIKS